MANVTVVNIDNKYSVFFLLFSFLHVVESLKIANCTLSKQFCNEFSFVDISV